MLRALRHACALLGDGLPRPRDASSPALLARCNPGLDVVAAACEALHGPAAADKHPISTNLRHEPGQVDVTHAFCTPGTKGRPYSRARSAYQSCQATAGGAERVICETDSRRPWRFIPMLRGHDSNRYSSMLFRVRVAEAVTQRRRQTRPATRDSQPWALFFGPFFEAHARSLGDLGRPAGHARTRTPMCALTARGNLPCVLPFLSPRSLHW
jgi:hypothetical protein